MKRIVILSLLVSLLASFALAQKAKVVVPTGSTGGVFFFYGNQVADIINKAGVADASAQQTGGSYDNILLLRDRSDPGSNTYYCALATTDSAYVTAIGQEPRFQAKKADMQRIMWYMYPSFIHIVTTEQSGIRVVQDLKGKRVSTGQPGSSTENLALLVLQGAGVKPEAFAKRERLPAAESAKALGDGSIDAYFWVGGVPTGSVVELGQTLSRKGQKIKLVPVDPKSTTAQVVLKRFPGIVSTTTLSKNVYGTSVDVFGFNTGNVFLCPASMPEALAYEITKAVFSNIQTLQTAVAAARDTTPKNSAAIYDPKAILQFHPGALKYFKEVGAIK